ncbi:TetR family transcriptional regulator [Sphingomonas spermidinifaciens]|uniref:TetR family transcriptional regulator n=1 Tax=Sphingomonas spermidinifaciens TaxID=1141889 RepID=A0A2A4B1G3_9SPHN|nr:TetR/AcrR family transcriptional regulator [Sphingomonas spermidinifaciens]PCD01910.1 TetR family transcriptional regulator [Sphingomonas spermidinifaciens]
MSTANSSLAATAQLAAGAVSRQPRQGRSRESFERMLAATRELMLERASEEFTLQDVSERGAVSIGSIYLRFESKDNLIHAVIAEALTEIISSESAMLAEVADQSKSLAEFVPRYVERYSQLLAEHAPMLRLVMQRASFDPAVSGPGKATAAQSARTAVEAMLHFRDEMPAADPAAKALAAFHIIFATMARHLSLGSTAEGADQTAFGALRVELAEMVLAYLRTSR